MPASGGRERLGWLAMMVAIAMACAIGSRADEPTGIQDNSFLVEEAYNQEPGVIQHIQVLQLIEGGAFSYSFTEEWPAGGQLHQASLTVPFSRLASPRRSGVGDVALNYRWQLRNARGVALAPRLSLLLPTGDEEKGLGSGSWGAQVNLPISVEVGRAHVTHWNLGGTWIPDALTETGEKVPTGSWSGGGSWIWLARPELNLMLEIAGLSSQSAGVGSPEWEHQGWLNPGFRYALNFDSGLQIVPGVSAPIGIGPDSDSGVLLYLSFEHPAF